MHEQVARNYSLGACSSFLSDYLRAREIWGERENWQWKHGEEPLAIRAFNGLCYSATHQLESGKWSDNEQMVLESAKLEYDTRHAASFTISDEPLQIETN